MLPVVIEICRKVKEMGGQALLVGGWVRDRVMGLESKDYDLEVYRLSPELLREILMRFGHVNTVGESFTVYKLRRGDSEIDVSLPRRESKIGRGHRGFTVTGDPLMTIEEAARRRDFTINAILYDPLTDEIIDPAGGVSDIKNRVIRVVDEKTFIEDSLRVLRAMQFAARFEFQIEQRTRELCRRVPLSDLPAERIWGEFEKLLLLSRHPSIGLKAALELGIIDQLFPELKALIGCQQDPDYHPEGDVWTHTLMVIDEAARIIDDLPKEKQLAVMLAALCHDLGKPLVTRRENGKVRAPDHDSAAAVPTAKMLDRLNIHTLNNYRLRSSILALVLHHLKPHRWHRKREQITDGDFRRLARRCELDLLYRVAKADALGRAGDFGAEAEEWFIERARSLGVEHGPPEPILKGRHLIDLGVHPGPQLGRCLDAVYEMQLDGAVTNLTEALEAAQLLIKELS